MYDEEEFNFEDDEYNPYNTNNALSKKNISKPS
jgi:hypothetical protein